MRHHHVAALRWSDSDMLGHVNQARALSRCDNDGLALCMVNLEDES